jgi:L-alanine-DL-glutamate epimerase-like enolase superfamily enzyme
MGILPMSFDKNTGETPVLHSAIVTRTFFLTILGMARLTFEKLILKLRNPFRLSYGTTEERPVFWVRLANDEGWGEAAIPPYYRVDPSAMTDCWERAARSDKPFPDDVAAIPDWIPEGPAPAKCALELALYDRIAKQRGVPLYQLLNLPKPGMMPTSFTIAIDTPEAMAKMARDIPDYSVIKIKLGSEDDESRVAAIREARPDATLRVDPNAGWTLPQSIANIKWLEKYNLEVLEQPLPREQIAELGDLQKHTKLPVIADESVQTFDDIEQLGKGGVRGINLKLMKVGGLTPALHILKRARAFNMKVMLGCMIETSLGTTAMAHLAGAADWLDLDAPLLINNDPFEGMTYDRHARIHVPDRAGIGAIHKGNVQ